MKLTTIQSVEENRAIYSQMTKGLYWIGLTDMNFEGDWEWIDNSSLSYTNWAYSEPNNFYGKQAGCAIMN